LQAERLVIGERASKGRETLYRVADRVLAHYYRKRFLLHGRQVSLLEAIAEFLEAFFTLEEKQAEAKRLRGLGLEADAAVLERLVQAELDGAGSWRSLVFAIAYRLRRYAALLVSTTAMPEFDAALAAFAEHRPKETLAAFRRQDLVALPDVQRLLWLLLVGSAATQYAEERPQAFAWLDEAVAWAETGGIAACCFAALEIRRLWFWVAGKRQEILADCRRSAELSNALPAGEWRRYALHNEAWLEGQGGHHETALALSRQLLDSARAAEDTFIGCRAWRLMAFNLSELGRYEEAVSAAQEAMVWAERCGDDRGGGAASRYLAISLGQLERYEEALVAAETALALAGKLMDQREMAWDWLEVFRQAHALGRCEQALDAYLALLAVPKDINEMRNWPVAWRQMHAAAQDAIHAGRWPDLQQAVAAHAEQFPHFSDKTGSAIADALDEILESQGQPAAFAAAASFIDSLAPLLSTESTEDVPLKPAFARLFQEAMGELAYRLDNPSLLRDIAQRIGERLPEDTATLRQMLEAAALYVESGNDPRSLERVDPDIALAIQRTRMPMNI
jgi:tetratricopeptide (TPR) repeat protein